MCMSQSEIWGLTQNVYHHQDAPKPGAGKHIVFGSDDDDDDDDKVENEEKKQATSEVTTKKTLFQDSQSEDDSTDHETSANEKKTIKEKVRERGYNTDYISYLSMSKQKDPH